MVVQFTPHTFPLLVAAGMAAIGAVVAWRRRQGSLEVWGTVVQCTILGWSVSLLALVSVTTFDGKRIFAMLYLLFAALAATTFLVFTIHFVGRSEWLTRTRLALILAVPAVTGIVAATNPIHGEVFLAPALDDGGSFVSLDYSFGPGYYFIFFLTYIYSVSFLGLLLNKSLKSRNVYRKMSLLLFVSLFVLLLGPAISVLGYSPFRHLMLLPYGYVALGSVLILGTSSSRFLRMLPVDRVFARFNPRSQQTKATARDFVVQEIDNGIIILDTSDVVVDINSTARRMIGANRPVGKHISEVAPYERIASDSVVREVLESGSEVPDMTDEIWVETDENERCYEVRVSALTDNSGSDAGRVILLHDITARKQREETLRERETELRRQKANLEKQKAQLEHQNERLDQFASIVSHDLRNPLNVARGRLQIVTDSLAGLDDPPVDPEHGETVERSLKRMEAIIDDALTLARQGKAITETQRVSLPETVETAWANVDTGAATLDCRADGPIESDKNRLLNVFENLFRNSVEHGSEDITVRVGLLDDGFYVEDDGPGIDEETKANIFDKGFTTSSEGTGFGLAIVEDIVRAHGWTVQVTDGRDGGARFEITDVAFSADSSG